MHAVGLWIADSKIWNLLLGKFLWDNEVNITNAPQK